MSDERLARGFPRTRHSALAAIRDGDPAERRRGLDVLAAVYWRPIYGYLRLRWRLAHEQAADLTQDFFAQLVDKDLLARFDPARARLRTYLRVCVDGLLANERKAARRLKRGGGAPAISFDFDAARAEVDRALGSAESPEALLDKEWSRALFTLALARLGERCRRENKTQHLELFEQRELASERPSYELLARRFGIAVTDVTNRLAWARRELRKEVLEVLRESTASEAEFRAEARALLGIDPP